MCYVLMYILHNVSIACGLAADVLHLLHRRHWRLDNKRALHPISGPSSSLPHTVISLALRSQQEALHLSTGC